MEELIRALKARHDELTEEAAALKAQSKGDEAVFRTVKANVCEICATVGGVYAKKGDPAAFAAILARFRKEWGAALEHAKQQDDAKKICVEETKLEALADVAALFAAEEA